MRIIAGKYRRRQLESLEGDETRPMLDRMRETLFNVLQMRIPGAVFADLYAGTGAVGIEALSRGAKRAVFVEASPKAARVIGDNLERVGAREDAELRISTVARALGSIDADIWFVGPPYPAHDEYAATLGALGERGADLVIAQHDARFDPGDRHGGLVRTRLLRMGKNALSFYGPGEEADEESGEEREEEFGERSEPADLER